MKPCVTALCGLAMAMLVATPLFAQEEGDYRTKDSGDWSNAQIWEQYNGSAWGPVAEPPTGSETITVDSTGTPDSVFVDVAVSITGTLINQGIVEGNENLTIADGGVYQHDRDLGKIPIATWAEGSTLLMTGTETDAPEDRNQNYHHIIFNTPNLLANLNMDLAGATISGDITVINTGLARWYLTSAEAGDTAEVTIMGDVIVEGGTFSVQGTSNANTTFIVHHYGDIEVSQAVDTVATNFSISRGSQGGGTTTWYLYEGDFTMSNASTQSSTLTPGGAKFVFAGEEPQTLSVSDLQNDEPVLPIEVSEGAMVDMGSTVLEGTGLFTVQAGGGIATALPGGVAAIVENLIAEPTFEDGSSYTFNGTEAQVTSEAMPAVVENLTIDNEAGVTLSQATTINGTLTLAAGVFDNTIPFDWGPDASITIVNGSTTEDYPDDVTVGNEPTSELPHTFYVEQNYPNPFNPTTVIRYGLPAAAAVTVRIYNVLGQEVWTSLEGHRPAGVHDYVFDAGSLSSGVYFYRVEAGEWAVTNRMVLVE